MTEEPKERKDDEQIVKEFRTAMEWANAIACDMRVRKMQISFDQRLFEHFGTLSDEELKKRICITKVL